MPDDLTATYRARVAQALIDLGDEHPYGRLDELAREAHRLRLSAPRIPRFVAEDAERQSAESTDFILRDRDRFEDLKGCIDRLTPLRLENEADRNGEGGDRVKAARARDRAHIWQLIWYGLNDRDLKRPMLPPAWCRKRNRAMLAASKALLRVRDVLNESTADPSLLGESFEPVLREFSRFVHLAWSQEPMDPNLYGGRGSVLRTLLGGTPRNMGWSKGGRFAASWLNTTEADLRAYGVPAEKARELCEAAGLTAAPPQVHSYPRHKPRKPGRRKPKAAQRRP